MVDVQDLRLNAVELCYVEGGMKETMLPLSDSARAIQRPETPCKCLGLGMMTEENCTGVATEMERDKNIKLGYREKSR